MILVLKIVGGEIFPESKQEDDDPLQMGGDFTLSRLMSVYQFLAPQSGAHTIAPHRDPNPSPTQSNPIHL